MTFNTSLCLAAMAGLLATGGAAGARTPPAPAPAAANPAPDPASPAAANPTAGGAAMDETRPVAVNASAAPNLSTLLTALKAAGLVTTLSGPRPFTVFAPTDEALSRPAAGTVDTLLKPANTAILAKVVTYHTVSGTLTLAGLLPKVKAGGGKATLTSIEGEPLTVEVVGDAVRITDVNGKPAPPQPKRRDESR